MSCPFRYSAASGARSSCGAPSLNSSTGPIRTTARSRENAAPERPATATSRPQFGSPPWTAVVDGDQRRRALAPPDDADRERLTGGLQSGRQQREIARIEGDTAGAVG